MSINDEPNCILAVAPSTIGLFEWHEIVRRRIGMIAEAWSRDVDLLSAEHVAESRPYEQRAVREVILTTGRLNPFVDTVDVASAVVHIRMIVDSQNGSRVVAVGQHLEELGAVATIEADLSHR